MGRIDNLNQGELQALVQRQRAAGTASPLGNSSVSDGALEIYSDEGLIVGGASGGGSAKVNGTLHVTGTEIVDGELVINGSLTIAGPTDITGDTTIDGNTTINGTFTLAGPVHITGATEITGTFAVKGATTLTGNLTVNAPGKITVNGSTVMTIGVVSTGWAGLGFPNGGAIASDGTNVKMFSGTGGGQVAAGPTFAQVTGPGGAHYLIITTAGTSITGGLTVVGGTRTDTLFTTGSKQFAIPHPLKAGMTLRHGATESPVSGIEYWGEETIGTDGGLSIDLPDYFETLAKAANRSVLVTARGFVADWTDIVNGSFTVTGEPGKRFSWLVKAERKWADFLTEDEDD